MSLLPCPAADLSTSEIASACFEHDLRIDRMMPVELIAAVDRSLDRDDIERLDGAEHALAAMAVTQNNITLEEATREIQRLFDTVADGGRRAAEEASEQVMMLLNHGTGWLGQASTPVRSDDGTSSWGWTSSTWFWAPTYSELLDAMFSWDELR